jgi:hypothetical protein
MVADAMPLFRSSISQTISPGAMSELWLLLLLIREERPPPNFGSLPKKSVTESRQVTRMVTETEVGLGGALLDGASGGVGGADAAASLAGPAALWAWGGMQLGSTDKPARTHAL